MHPDVRRDAPSTYVLFLLLGVDDDDDDPADDITQCIDRLVAQQAARLGFDLGVVDSALRWWKGWN